MQKLLKLLITATAAATTLSSTALFADPFSGVIVEGALGVSQIKSDASSVQTVSAPEANPANPSLVGNTSLDAPKDTGSAGRLGVGYAYTLPIINLNLAGMLTYNVGDQKLKQNGLQDTGRPGIPSADISGWTTKVKNAWELRFQPGYYVFPLRILVYGTIGYARAKLDSSGKTFNLASENTWGLTRDPVGQGSVNLNGYVLGIGAKYSPIPLIHLYVGADYSHTTYNNKKISGQTTGYYGGGTFPVSWESNPGKIKTDTFLVTVGYYF